MGIEPSKQRTRAAIVVVCICLLLCLSACQENSGNNQNQTGNTPTATQMPQMPSATPTATVGGMTMEVPGQHATPTAGGKGPKGATPTASSSPTPNSQPSPIPPPNGSRPVLAFYYMWYNTSTWSLSTMSDLPTVQYNSSDDATINRQLTWASNAGITGFISSWWGPGDQTDTNFVKLLADSASLQSRTHYRFASSLYFECDAPALQGESSMVSALRYINAHYTSDPHFFHWQGKPVLFFWDPLGNGRTLSEWADIRNQVDPNDNMIWSAEGVDLDMLSVFDGIHLFSAGYWGLENNDMATVDQGFRNNIDAYNSTNGTHKIWAAGVMPGYNDTRVPGRTGTFIVPRNNGSTYAASWQGAMASNPDWITITSFNEWFEGAMIEPSVTYGMQYLNLTQQYAGQWENQ